MQSLIMYIRLTSTRIDLVMHVWLFKAIHFVANDQLKPNKITGNLSKYYFILFVFITDSWILSTSYFSVGL